MEAPDTNDVHDTERLTTDEVLKMARISRASLWRRVASGRLPMPIDRARQALFSRAAVMAALKVDSRPAAHALITEARLEALRRRRHKGALLWEKPRLKTRIHSGKNTE